jgi:excisionase family DNA binding protein
MAALLEDGSVLLTPLDCGLIVIAESGIREWWNRNALIHPDLLPLLAVMRSSAASAALASPPHRGAVPVVSKVAALGFVTSELVVTVKEAAERLGISEQAVTKAIREGRLSGSRVGRGPWEIGAGSVDKYTSRCSNRPREAEFMSEAEFQAVKVELLELQADIQQIEHDVRDLAAAS